MPELDDEIARSHFSKNGLEKNAMTTKWTCLFFFSSFSDKYIYINCMLHVTMLLFSKKLLTRNLLILLKL